MLKTYIIINTQVEGLHNWPACDIKEVEFLKFPHRHIFHICAKKEVDHHDRDIEIIRLKREITSFINNKYGIGHQHAEGCDFGSKSCEMLATELVNKFDLDYCSVLEDGENGAEVHNIRIFNKPLQTLINQH